MVNDAARKRFYITGGTLHPDAPSYVRRVADEDLFNNLTRGEFCYVLNARQMGKSSLMASTAARLSQARIKPVLVDLTAIGLNVTLDQWYFGLASHLAAQLDKAEELGAIWDRHALHGPQQRWTLTLIEMVSDLDQQVVIFVDEIDLVRSLPFRTDEFFAGIRELYNRRSSSPELNRLTFCLLGVTTPAELIDDPATTPFNIGVRVSLSDFTFEEAQLLAQGLDYGRDGYSLLKRVFYWTDGHPYLTQRLCRAISENPDVYNDRGVDDLCFRLFLSPEGRDKDDNLLFVRDRLRDNSIPDSRLQYAYLRVLRGSAKAEAMGSGVVMAKLVLSGAVKVVGGRLRVRNRLYARAFDKKWVLNSLPNAEQRKIRRAFWVGFARAATPSAALCIALAGVAVYALNMSHLASAKASEALARERELDSTYYGSAIHGVQADLGGSAIDVDRAKGTLQEVSARVPHLRGIEWSHLWRACNEPVSAYRREFAVFGNAFVARLGQSRLVCAESKDPDHGRLAISDVSTGHLWKIIETPKSIWQLAVAGQRIFAMVGNGVLEYDVLSGARLATFYPPHGFSLHGFRVAPNGRLLALWTDSGPGRQGLLRGFRLVDLDKREPVGDLAVGQRVQDFAFVSDSRLVYGDTMQQIYEVRASPGATSKLVFRAPGAVLGLSVSPRANRCALMCSDGFTVIVDTANWRLVTEFETQHSTAYRIGSVLLSDAGSELLACDSNLVQERNLATGVTRTLVARPAAACFLGDGSVALGELDRVEVWRPETAPAIVQFPPLEGRTTFDGSVRFSRDGAQLVSSCWWSADRRWPVAGPTLSVPPSDVTVRTDAAGFSIIRSTGARHFSLGHVVEYRISETGNRVLILTQDSELRIFDTRTLAQIAQLPRVSFAALAPDGSSAAAILFDEEVYGPSFFGSKRPMVENFREVAMIWSPDRGWRQIACTDAKRDGFTWQTLHYESAGALLQCSYYYVQQDQTVAAIETVDRAAVAPLGIYREAPDEGGVPITAIDDASNGMRLITGTADGRVQIRDSITMKVLVEFQRDSPRKVGIVPTEPIRPNARMVQSIAVSPDGASFAVAYADGAVTLWRGTTLAEADKQIAAESGAPGALATPR